MVCAPLVSWLFWITARKATKEVRIVILGEPIKSLRKKGENVKKGKEFLRKKQGIPKSKERKIGVVFAELQARVMNLFQARPES